MKHLPARLSFSQFASGSVSGVFIPFFSASLAWRGISPGQIGLLLSAALMLRAVAGPLSGIFADARNDRRAVMLVLYWIMVAGFGGLCVAGSPLLIFLVSIPAYVAYGAATPLLESVSVRLAERFGFDYGKVRIWASTAFVVMNVTGGIVVKFLGLGAVAPMLTLGAALCIVATLVLPAPPASEGCAPLKVRLKTTFDETKELLQVPVFLIFLAAASCEQATHAFYYGYGGLHWKAIGYSELLIGIIWPLGVLAEIALFNLSSRISYRFGPCKLLMLGGLFTMVRWTILAFDPPLPLAIFAQFMHGGTFALAHLGAVFFISRAVPPRLAATAQSLYFVGSQGVMMGIATLAIGPVYATLGGRAYLMMTALGLVSLGFTWMMARRWNGEAIIHGDPGEHIDTI